MQLYPFPIFWVVFQKEAPVSKWEPVCHVKPEPLPVSVPHWARQTPASVGGSEQVGFVVSSQPGILMHLLDHWGLSLQALLLLMCSDPVPLVAGGDACLLPAQLVHWTWEGGPWPRTYLHGTEAEHVQHSRGGRTPGHAVNGWQHPRNGWNTNSKGSLLDWQVSRSTHTARKQSL